MGNGGGLIKGAQPHNYRPPISAAIIAGGGLKLIYSLVFFDKPPQA